MEQSITVAQLLEYFPILNFVLIGFLLVMLYRTRDR